MKRKKKLTLIFVATVIVIALIAFILQPATPAPYRECVLNTCDCQCHIKGQITQQTSETVCRTDCKQLFNIIGCKYVGLECPYVITGCAIVDAINDIFISKQCEIIKEK